MAPDAGRLLEQPLTVQETRPAVGGDTAGEKASGRRKLSIPVCKFSMSSSLLIGNQVTQSKQVDFLQPLIDRLTHCVKRLLHENTSSAVLPDSWDTYKDTLSSCLDLDDKVDRAILRSLSERNARIQQPKDQSGTAQRSRRQLAIHTLDSIRSTHDVNAISTSCLDTIEDRTLLISTLLEWTASTFRHGIFRVFTSVRLLRRWKAVGIDIDSHIFAFLSRAGNSNGMEMCHVYHVISELVRSQTFSVGRYFQWLMARGGTDGYQSSKGKVC